ncbi:autotransporter-associated beta strand repeat-containing protein [Luteolibacter sp. LG18]|uniref:beta strand repeat-containing protein n=1 Tax=Luteolibacter sp. LG18 TaxID=2819286 RepID=UPI0030C67E45
MHQTRRIPLTAVGLLLTAPLTVHAKTWTGTTSAAWNVDTNWLEGTQPASGEAVTFDSNSTANLSNTLEGAFTVSGVSVASPTGKVTIANGTGGTLAIGASGIDLSAATQDLAFSFTANSLVSFGADQTFNVAASRTLSFTGTANNRTFGLGSRTLTKTGTGSLTFGPGVSLASGTFDLQGGTTTLTAGNNISTTTASTVSYKVGSGATLALIWNSGTLTSASPITLNGGAIATSGGSSPVLSGQITGTGGTITATQSSTGTITDTFSGGFSGSGTFDLKCHLTSSTTHAFVFSGNNSGFSGTFNLNGTTGTRTVRLTNANAGSTTATWNVQAGNTLQVNNVSVGLGNLSILSGGTGTFLTGSTVAFGATKTVLVDAQATTTNTTLTVAGTVNHAGAFTAGRASVVNLNSGAAWNHSGDFTVAGNGGFGANTTVNTGATLTYTGANTIKLNPGTSSNGTLTVNGGTLSTLAPFQSTVASTTPGAFNGVVVLQNAGTLKLGADVADVTTAPTGTATKVLFQLGTGGGTIDTNGFTATVSQNITGAGALTKAGTGTLFLTGTNTYTGDTTVSAGTLSLGTASLANASKVNLAATATLDLTHAATDTIDQLFIDGVQQVAGIWGSPTSGAAHTSPRITGTGLLNVATGPPGYASWAAGKGLTTGVNDGFADDPDGDGRINLAEFALDGSPLSGASTGKVVGKVATLTISSVSQTVQTLTLPVRGTPAFSGNPQLVSEAVDGVIYQIESAVDLVHWNLVPVQEVPSADASTFQGTLNLPALSTGWTYRTFYVPSSDPASNSALFIRAKLSSTP